VDKVPSVIIADEHAIVREGIASKLKEACNAEILGMVSDEYATLKLCRTLTPDVLFLDISLSRPSSLELFMKLRATQPNLTIVILTAEPSVRLAYLAILHGAAAFVPKNAGSDQLVYALQSIQLGFSTMPTEYLKEFVTVRNDIVRSGNMFGLSPRESQVLEAIRSGYSPDEIARQLDISIRTVEAHKSALFRKTESKNTRELLNSFDSFSSTENSSDLAFATGA
jgi:DNA-binding NarL/FixJ family response regulator